MHWREELRAAREAAAREINLRNAQLNRFAAKAEAVGREIYAGSIRTGHKVAAATPSEIRELGLAALQGRLPQAIGGQIARKAVERMAAPPAKGRASPGVTKVAGRPPSNPAIKEQIRAATSGAVDEASLGLADHVLAASNALGDAIQAGDGRNFLADYQDSMAKKRAADAYDAKHLGTERNVGRAVGFAGSVAAMGAPGLARAAIAAIPRGRAAEQVIRLGLRYAPDPRGLTKMMAAGGGGAGLLDQAASDAVTGHRSTLGDYAAAAGGGALGGAATRYAGPVLGGAVGGVSTSVLSDLANGRSPSFDNALETGRLAAVFGGIGDGLGQRWAKNLSPWDKGKLGDTLSAVKATARGEDVVRQQARVYLEPGGYTVADNVSVPRGLADERTNWILNESKLGPHASLTERQQQALQEFGDRYIVDFWRYADVGKISGSGLSPYGANSMDRPER